MANKEDYEDTLEHIKREHPRGEVLENHREDNQDVEEPRDPINEADESFEQIHAGATESEPGHHHIHTEDEPLKPSAELQLDDEAGPEPENGEMEEGRNDEIEIDKEEDEGDIAGEVVEPSVEQDEQEPENEKIEADEAGFEYEPADAAAEEGFIVKNDEDREGADGETEKVTIEEVPGEIVTTEEETVAIDNKETEKQSLESEMFDVFKLFDYETSETIDIKYKDFLISDVYCIDDNQDLSYFSDLGNVLRCLQLNPTEAEVKALQEEVLQRLVSDFQFGSNSSKITWSDFLPKVIEIVEAERFKPATEDELITAFSLLDTDKKGFLTVEQLRAALLKLGEPLNEEEFEEMLATATDFDADCFNYVEYAKLLVCS